MIHKNMLGIIPGTLKHTDPRQRARAAALFNQASTYPLALMCVLIPLVGAIGAYGAELTFPVHHE